MATKLTWNGDAFKEHLRNATNSGLKSATVFYHTQCRLTVSVSNPRNEETGEYDTPSEPGDAPRLRTGFGRAGIVWEYDEEKMEGRVGVTLNALYMFWLEIGTKYIARRPWLLSTLLSHQETIGLLAASGATTTEKGNNSNG